MKLAKDYMLHTESSDDVFRIYDLMIYNILTPRDYAEATERSPMGGGSDSTRGLPLSAFFSTPLQFPLTNDK
jgi:hypothetical protein